MELPSTMVMFCTVSRGVVCRWHCALVHTWFGSQVFWYRMRTAPPPLSVILPPPSSTTSGRLLNTLAVCVMVIVTGSAPQLKVMTPPCATAFTTAADVQLAGVPLPITVVGDATLAA